jgi:hypothetical protein
VHGDRHVGVLLAVEGHQALKVHVVHGCGGGRARAG